MRLAASSGGQLEGEVGFSIEGPFSFEDPGKLPLAEWELTRFAGEEEVTLTFISTGDAAFVVLDGQAYELPPEQIENIGPANLDGGLNGLRVDEWVVEAEETEGAEDTEVIRG